jgi:hypothetical protein
MKRSLNKRERLDLEYSMHALTLFGAVMFFLCIFILIVIFTMPAPFPSVQGGI